MKILFIWDADYPWDIRVEKICNSLIAKGHDIHMVCRNTKRRSRSEKYKSINLHRIMSLPGFMGKLNNSFSFPFFLSPIWIWEIFKQVLCNKCKLIIVRDLPMALAGILIGKIMRIPVIMDMAECYPEMLRCTWRFERVKFRNIFLRNPYLADIVESLVLCLVDHVIVMIEESRDRLLEKKMNPSRIHIISNTPLYERFLTNAEKMGNVKNNKQLMRLIYIGLLNPSRGLDTVIISIKKYIKINPNFEFLIIGSGKAEEDLKNLVKKNRLEEYVYFKGWVDNTEIPEYIRNSDIGIIPHHRCSHWENTIPNKLFDYMASGKPVIVSNVKPMERIVREVNCGLVYEDYNTDDLVRKMKELENGNLRNELSENAVRAIKSHFNWYREQNNLYKLVDSINENK